MSLWVRYAEVSLDAPQLNTIPIGEYKAECGHAGKRHLVDAAVINISKVGRKLQHEANQRHTSNREYSKVITADKRFLFVYKMVVAKHYRLDHVYVRLIMSREGERAKGRGAVNK